MRNTLLLLCCAFGLHAQALSLSVDVFDKIDNYTEQRRQQGLDKHDNDSERLRRRGPTSLIQIPESESAVSPKLFPVCVMSALTALLGTLYYVKIRRVDNKHRRKHRLRSVSNTYSLPLVQRSPRAKIAHLPRMVSSVAVSSGRPLCDCCRNELSDTAIANVLAFTASGYRSTKVHKLS